MPKRPTVPIRLRHVLAGAFVVVASSSAAGVAAEPAAPGPTAHRAGRCAAFSTNPADFPRSVPLPQDEYQVRGYLRVDCKQLLDLAMDTDDLAPVQSDLVSRLRAKEFRDVRSTSRMVEVDLGPGVEPEMREVFVIRASGRGLRVKVELSFVGAAPRWGGTALVRYKLRPLR